MSVFFGEDGGCPQFVRGRSGMTGGGVRCTQFVHGRSHKTIRRGRIVRAFHGSVITHGLDTVRVTRLILGNLLTQPNPTRDISNTS